MIVKTRATGIVGATRLDTDSQSTGHKFISSSSSERQGTLFPISFAERKTSFLHGLTSQSGKKKYKRYTGAPIRYAGGKSLAVGLVVERIPDDVERIVSPFLGGGSVEVACSVELGLPVISCDVFDILINYWEVKMLEGSDIVAIHGKAARRFGRW